MPNDRLKLALELMGPGDWLTFERFAAEFNAVEFPSLRTTAAFAGDKGRDGQLFRPNEDATTVFQYSVTASWRSKIEGTLATLRANGSSATRIIYCTNQAIGPSADDLVADFRAKGIALDIRDRSWFTDRELTHAQRQATSEELAARFVQPLLEARGIAVKIARPLKSDEARVALLHLALEGYDQQTDKNLTRSCFESLVRSVLHGTDSTSPRSLREISDEVRALVPAGDPAQVNAQTEGALHRLSTRGGPVKQVAKTEVYHLSYEEQRQLEERSTQFLLDDAAVNQELSNAAARIDPMLDDEQLADAVREIRSALEATLAAKSEDFATAVVSGSIRQIGAQEVLDIVRQDALALLTPEQVAAVVLDVLESPGPATHRHLRRLADAYTLFAFLRQTPDVQKVVLQVFQDGEVWLDTSVVLPLLAETLIEDPSERYFTILLQAARDAGLQLFVTSGIVEEVERHLNRGLLFARTETSAWESSVPFIYAAYAMAGRGRSQFASWLEEFRGSQVPEEDIQQMLKEDFGIDLRNLKELADNADPLLRAAVQEIWHSVHDRRRGNSGSDITPAVTLRLVAHDVENSVGVIELRKGSAMGPMGYRAWWLTLDRTAFNMEKKLRDRLGGDVPRSPALSPDFLVELLRLGPLRSAVEREVHVALPVMADIGRYEGMPMELITLSDRVRKDSIGLSERVIARKVRDSLNDAKWRLGATADKGATGALAIIEERLAGQAARS